MFTNYDFLRTVPKSDIEAYMSVYQISDLILGFERDHPDPADRPLYRCHSIARAIAENVKDVTVVDGHLIGIIHVKDEKAKMPHLREVYYPHTWLTAPGGTIIDPYPVGVISRPLLVPVKVPNKHILLAACGANKYYTNGKLPRSLVKKFVSPLILEEAEILAKHIAKLLREVEKEKAMA